MFAVVAVIAFAIALILHLVRGGGGLVLTFELAGFICVAAHLVWGVFPWRRA